jgi:hypothetical protein
VSLNEFGLLLSFNWSRCFSDKYRCPLELSTVRHFGPENVDGLMSTHITGIFHVYCIKLSLRFFLTDHQAMKAYWGSGGIAPCIL